MSKKRYLKGLTFDFEANEKMPLGPHISYTTASVGGAASGLNKPVVLKSDDEPGITKEDFAILKAAKEVRLELSMEEFLRRWCGLYYDEAALLAKILGYESSLDDDATDANSEYYQNWVDERVSQVTLLKSLNTEEDFYNLKAAEQFAVLEAQKMFEAGLVNNKEAIIKHVVGKLSTTAVEEEVALSGLPDSLKDDVLKEVEKSKGSHEEGETMSDKNTDDLKAINKQLTDELTVLKSTVEALTKEKEERELKAFIKKAGEFSFVEKDKVEALGTVLKSLAPEDQLLLLETLQKAAEAIQNAQGDMFEYRSVAGESDSVPTTAVQKSKSATAAAVKRLLGTNESGE